MRMLLKIKVNFSPFSFCQPYTKSFILSKICTCPGWDGFIFLVCKNIPTSMMNLAFFSFRAEEPEADPRGHADCGPSAHTAAQRIKTFNFAILKVFLPFPPGALILSWMAAGPLLRQIQKLLKLTVS